jgi:hypothetical protein
MPAAPDFRPGDRSTSWPGSGSSVGAPRQQFADVGEPVDHGGKVPGGTGPNTRQRRQPLPNLFEIFQSPFDIRE